MRAPQKKFRVQKMCLSVELETVWQEISDRDKVCSLQKIITCTKLVYLLWFINSKMLNVSSHYEESQSQQTTLCCHHIRIAISNQLALLMNEA